LRITLPILAAFLVLGCTYEDKRKACVESFADCAGRCYRNPPPSEEPATNDCEIHCLKHLGICVGKARESNP
jgi:hypothetical protein